MKEYIDREAVCAEIDKGDLLVGNNAEWAKEIVHRTPTADVVAVVRCKDCLHRGPIKNNSMICLITGDYVPKDHFCSCGARKGQKENV
jgi:hypothetical protein